MTTPKHILFLTPGFAKDKNDTACVTYLQNYFLALKKYRHELNFTIVTIHYPFSISKYKWHGINVYSIGGNNKRGLNKFFIWRRVIKQIREIQKNQPIDLIHSFWMKECALLGNLLTRSFGIGHLCTAMGTEVLGNRYFPLLNPEHFRVVAVSDFQQKLIPRKFFKKDIPVIPWGIEPQEAETVPTFEDREIDILGVGFLNRTKDYDSFIKIVISLLKENKALNIRIIGGGDQAEKIKSKLKATNIQNKINLLGTIENAQVILHMKNSKVLLHTSSFESQGYVFLEALMYGMKIVSRKVGIAEESPYWQLADTHEEFCQKLSNALRPSKTEKIVMFPVSETVEQYTNIYNCMSGKKNK